MARGRFVSKEITTDAKVARLGISHGAPGALFWTWLIPHLDAEGRAQGDPMALKALVCPMIAELTPESVAAIIDEMGQLGLVRLYSSGGQRWLDVPGFEKNQVGLRRDREAMSKIPPYKPPESLNSGPTPDLLRTTPGVLPDNSGLSKGNLRQVKAMDKAQLTLTSPAKPAAFSPEVEKVIAHYLARFPRRGVSARADDVVKKIKARMMEGYAADDLCRAIDGNLASPVHIEGKYDSLELIVRDAKHVDMMLGFAPAASASTDPGGYTWPKLAELAELVGMPPIHSMHMSRIREAFPAFADFDSAVREQCQNNSHSEGWVTTLDRITKGAV